MNLCIIPARGGSKRVPRKNIKEFCGKPMIAWSIVAAQESGLFNHIIVSTDDDEIAAVAECYGAEVPFRRPAELADDHAGTTEVIAHATQWALDQGWSLDAVCCLYATAPFIQVEDLRTGLQQLQQQQADFAFGVTRYAFPIQRALRMTTAGRVEMFQPEHFQTRSQDLEEAWHDAGQFYWGRASAWLEGKPLFSSAAIAVPLPQHRVQDIDTNEDWERAEWLFKAMQANQDTK